MERHRAAVRRPKPTWALVKYKDSPETGGFLGGDFPHWQLPDPGRELCRVTVLLSALADPCLIDPRTGTARYFLGREICFPFNYFSLKWHVSRQGDGGKLALLVLLMLGVGL